MSELTERIAGLSDERRELLTRLLQKKGVDISALPISRRTNPTERLPLSFAQQRLWFLDQLEPGSNFYNIFDTYAFSGPFEPLVLEQSLNEILRRHETLRTTFGIVDGEPIQRIAPSAVVSLPIVDLSDLSLDVREREASRFAAESAGLPFDLDSGPLARFTLLRLDEEEHVLLIGMHHIISDAWSLTVFIRELRTLYDAFVNGSASPLPELSIQYADYALWQRQWLQGEVLETQLAYWVHQLSGAPAALELPIDKPRPLVPTHQGASQSLLLSDGLSQSLRSLSLRENGTLFMTLLAAFNVLLDRYSNQEDIVVGTPVAGRNRAETEQLIGFFINTLVIRTQLSGDPTFIELLARVRETTLAAFVHQDLPFEKLVEVLHPERDMSRNPLFQVSFQMSYAADSWDEQMEVDGEVEFSAAKFDLGFNAWETSAGLRVQADYSTDLFEDATITRMLRNFETLLESIEARPEDHISELRMLTEAESARLLHEWNNTSSDYPHSACLHELFETHASLNPNAVAVICNGESLSYSDLNHRANQVARGLRELGVGRDVVVGISMDRSIDFVVGLLGILKAGGAYVPLDPEYPDQRLRYMIEDAGVRVMLTQSHLAKEISAAHATTICIDSEWEQFGSDSVIGLDHVAMPENIAHIIYTSGSTGTPKGVVVTHQAVARTVCGTNYISIGPGDRVAQASNSSFDAATFEIWGALLNGATLVIISKETLISPRDLATCVRDLEISVLFLPTALFNQIAAENPAAFNSVRYVLFGGEMVDPRWVREVLASGPPNHLLHMYGPTESTTYASWHQVENLSADANTVPIGRPVSNTQIYLLDRSGWPVPLGVPGELYVGGDGLARGYLNRAALTAERFVPDPFGGSPGARLYRTGDVARYLPNGAIEFLGRRDEQVKVRGYRIELGEVENNLRDHEHVRECIVLAREDVPGQKRLIAYIVAEGEEYPSPADLRSFMKERVPDYMTPGAFILLSELPLTPNGKVDRRALPAPELGRLEYDEGFVSPRTPVETSLTEIFSTVLSVEMVGINDNFFELGGHSLLATQVLSRIRETFKIELPLRELFSNPTVASLSAVVDEGLKLQSGPNPASITKVSRDAYRATVSPAGVLEVSEALKSSVQAAE